MMADFDSLSRMVIKRDAGKRRARVAARPSEFSAWREAAGVELPATLTLINARLAAIGGGLRATLAPPASLLATRAMLPAAVHHTRVLLAATPAPPKGDV
jgi:hypothetical protein